MNCLPHTSDYLSIKQKPITYDKNAKAKRFPSFIREVVYEQDEQTAIDVLSVHIPP